MRRALWTTGLLLALLAPFVSACSLFGIRTYEEADWARLPDSAGPVSLTLPLVEALQARLVYMLQRLEPADFERTLFHPDLGELTVGMLVPLYAWHGRHHVAHITALREREGW